jgi:hypothetical protein
MRSVGTSMIRSSDLDEELRTLDDQVSGVDEELRTLDDEVLRPR